MNPTLAELNAEIQKHTEQLEELQKQAAELKERERESVIETMRRQISDYDISAAELGLAGAGARAKARSPREAAPKPGAKYVGPQGQLWSGGRGRKPRWVMEALAAGKSLTDFERKTR